MKCVFCQGKLVDGKTEYKEFGVKLGIFPAKVCSKCGEAVFDSETSDKIQQKSKEMGLFGLRKRTKIALVGNSLAIRIPKEIAEFVGFQKEKEVTLYPNDKKGILVEVC